MKYTYKFTPRKKIDNRRFKMAQLTVYDINGAMIGAYAWSYLQRRNRGQEITAKVEMLILDHETRKDIRRSRIFA